MHLSSSPFLFIAGKANKKKNKEKEIKWSAVIDRLEKISEEWG